MIDYPAVSPHPTLATSRVTCPVLKKVPAAGITLSAPVRRLRQAGSERPGRCQVSPGDPNGDASPGGAAGLCAASAAVSRTVMTLKA
eukprot:25531-Hanusia_phi.AAC.1